MGMFNTYDEQAKQAASPLNTGLSLAKLPAGRGTVALAGQAGSMLGQGAMGAMGLQTPAQKRQEGLAKIQADFPNPQTEKDFISMGNAYNSIGESDIAEKAFEQAKRLQGTKPTAAHTQGLADMNATLNFLEKSKGFKLNDDEAAYFKSRIKKDVSITMSGQVVDTAPNVFDQIIAARGKKVNNDGIGDTGVTLAGKEKKSLELDKKVTDLSTDLNKVDGADMALQQLERKFKNFTDAKTGKLIADVPGLSAWEKYTRSAEGDDISALWENLLGEIRHERFGSVLTANEQKMFEKIKTGNPFFLPDEAVLNYIKRMRETIDSKKAKIRKGYANDVTARFDARSETVKKSNNLSKKQQDLLSKYNIK